MGAFSTGQNIGTISIQKSPQYLKNGFDFNQSRVLVNQSILSFPSYINYYPKMNQTSFSLMQDKKNQICCFTLNHQGRKEVLLKKVNRKDKPKIWKVIVQSEIQRIEQGDFIRIGKVQIKIKQVKTLNQSGRMHLFERQKKRKGTLFDSNIHTHEHQSKILSNSGIDYSRMYGSQMSNRTSQPCCRICFDARDSSLDPLLTVCKCSGSVKWIHYQCLRGWIRSKAEIRENSLTVTYRTDPHPCQICKEQIPTTVRHNGKQYHLIQADTMHPPFLSLEYNLNDKNYRTLVCLEESSKVYIGRGSQNDVQINDSSINRNHCALIFKENQLSLQGHSTKYGTFWQLSGRLELAEDRPLELMIGNSMVTISQSAHQSNLGECCNAEDNLFVLVQ